MDFMDKLVSLEVRLSELTYGTPAYDRVQQQINKLLGV